VVAEAEQREATRRLKSLSTAGWLVDQNSHSPRAARDDVRLAMGLSQTPLVADALADGRVSAEQAGAILNGLRRLPEDFDDDQRTAVVGQLVGSRRVSTPASCRVWCTGRSRSSPLRLLMRLTGQRSSVWMLLSVGTGT